VGRALYGVFPGKSNSDGGKMESFKQKLDISLGRQIQLQRLKKECRCSSLPAQLV
jgi:hypothetical protein